MSAKIIRKDLNKYLSSAMSNLRKALDYAGKDQYTRGMWWYSDAHNDCSLAAQELDLPLDQFVGVVSALSPQMKWERNVPEAYRVVLDRTYSPATYGYCLKKAHKILDGADIVATLGGPKTISFYHCIMEPLLSWKVAVDRHQIRLLFPDLSHSYRNSMLKCFYPQLEELHHVVADERGLVPNQAQAISWIVQREGGYEQLRLL